MKSLTDAPRRATASIAVFCDLVKQGIDAWVAAGEVLCLLVKDDPLVFDKIMSQSPMLTRDVLESFERVGRKEIYPILLADPSPGAKYLAGFAYAEQVRLYKAKIVVVVKSCGGHQQKFKRVTELTEVEAKRVFDVNRVRTAQEQIKILNHRSFGHNGSSGHGNVSDRKPAEPMKIAASSGRLDESSTDELVRLLKEIQERLLQARTALAIIKGPESPRDRLIAVALTSVGELSYATANGEL